jgi:tRNA-specific 2-thiouridylase
MAGHEPLMRVLLAMSGGVDSSVAAALLLEAGHEVVGVTLKLWGGESDRGCCSVADVDDARSVARRLGIDHHVFNFGDDFDEHVVAPYLADHLAGRTPNPCIECNRHLKFDRLLRRAEALGFEAVATGHHARIVDGRVARGADAAKDQSYVLNMLGPDVLGRIRFPVGHLTKADVRAEAGRLGLATADKPDSQDVCFITASGGRTTFLGDRIGVRPAKVVDRAGVEVGHVDAIELVTLGQRKGLGLPGGGPVQYVTDIDVGHQVVTVGGEQDLLVTRVPLEDLVWTDGVVDGDLFAQSSAHGVPRPATVVGDAVVHAEPVRRVAPGQSVVLYDGDQVVAAGIAV